jgi:hypothetical protein
MQTSVCPSRPATNPMAAAEDGLLSQEEKVFVHNCWRFLNASRRVDAGRLPRGGEGEYSLLEAYLLLAHTITQAGLFWSMKVPFGDAGAEFLFPGAERMDDVPQAEWDAFAERALALQCRIAEEL